MIDGVDASSGQGLQVGEGNTQHNYYGGRRSVAWPYQAGVVPVLADRRQRRPADDELAAVAAGRTVVVCQVLAGLGGVGKTQLAAGLAHQLWRDRQVDLLMWITATARAGILTTYAQASADITGIEDADPAAGAARLLAWLAATDRRWLIVLDDLADPADLRGLWPPETATGRTVVTTRRRDAALLDGRRLIDVDLFTRVEALAYLGGKLGAAEHRLDEAAELAEDLGRLPLALAQAAAYIQDQDLTCAGYRTRLASRKLDKLRPHLLPDDQATPVAETWALCVDLADAETGGAAGVLLQIAAPLDPNGIPAEAFATEAVTGYCGYRLGRTVEADDTRDAIRVLHRLGLADANQDSGGSVRIHRLVQRATREATARDHRRDLATAAGNALLELWPPIERDVTHAQSLRANAVSLYAGCGSMLWRRERGGHGVMFRIGRSLGDTGLVAAAVEHFRELLAVADRQLGADHRDTLSARAELAHWRGHAGDSAAAITDLTRLLADHERILGKDHPDTLATRSNLADWQGRAGDSAAAVAVLERLLADYQRVLGPDHPHTLISRGNLAKWRGNAGDAPGAVAALEQLLADHLRVLGPDHLDTLTTRSHLADWRGRAGDTAGAVAAYERLLGDRMQTLGPDHPRVLTTRSNLADWRGRAGDAAGAAVAFEQLLADRLRVLGPDHPRILTARSSVAYWRGRAGDAAGAVAAFEQLLADCLRFLGPDHPQTGTARKHLAHWHSRAARD